MNWAAKYSATLVADGYRQGQASPCLFFHPGKDVAIMVHGDDFVAVGAEKDLADTRATFEAKYKLNVECLGDGKGCTHEIRVLNKVPAPHQGGH